MKYDIMPYKIKNILMIDYCDVSDCTLYLHGAAIKKTPLQKLQYL